MAQFQMLVDIGNMLVKYGQIMTSQNGGIYYLAVIIILYQDRIERKTRLKIVNFCLTFAIMSCSNIKEIDMQRQYAKNIDITFELEPCVRKSTSVPITFHVHNKNPINI